MKAGIHTDVIIMDVKRALNLRNYWMHIGVTFMLGTLRCTNAQHVAKVRYLMQWQMVPIQDTYSLTPPQLQNVNSTIKSHGIHFWRCFLVLSENIEF